MLSKWLEKYHLKKWFKRDNLFVMVLVGILLVIIVLPVNEKGNGGTEAHVQESSKEKLSAEPVQEEELYTYASYLERELEEILTQMKGVGKVAVMITLEGSRELIVHQDETYTCNDTTETDSQGGNRSVFQTDMQGKTVYEKTVQGESPYVVQTKLPKVSGVLIVAQGAGNGSVKKNIVQIAEALLDVEVHKVTVVAME
jgi:stage III sporulation protein AG